MSEVIQTKTFRNILKALPSIAVIAFPSGGDDPELIIFKKRNLIWIQLRSHFALRLAWVAVKLGITLFIGQYLIQLDEKRYYYHLRFFGQILRSLLSHSEKDFP